MCGISGFYNSNTDYLSKPDLYRHILKDMGTALHHRGPDDSGIILTQNCGLSHTRLSIIDIKGGHQPMTKEYSDNRCHIIYNGEIYNMPELRHALSLRNVTFKTDSDTELLLLSYLEFGPSFIKNVDGIFSIAIYDELHKTLILFRDCFGVKPLFYTFADASGRLSYNSVIFSSEPKGILAYPGIKALLDADGLNEILGLGPARTPGCGIFKNFYEVLPGSYISISPYGANTVKYFRLESHPHEDSYVKTIEKTRFYVTDAIRRQMVSDVPICTFLSGGVDSSVVSAICSKELKTKNKQLSTFSFDFKNNEQYFKSNSFQPSMDRPFVEQMVSWLDSNHTYLQCDNKTQADYLYRSVDAHDFPAMADIDSSLLYFCEQVSHSHKVVLTGECADEVFGGYPWFHRKELLECNTFPWTPSLAPRQSLLSHELLEKLHMNEYVENAYNTSISEVDILPGEDAVETNRRRIGYLNIRFFMQTLLNRMDRTSMNNGLEARVPFADKQLVSYIFNVPWKMKNKDGIVKNVLRQSCHGLLPDEILFRKKSPYPKTYDPYYEALLSTRLRKVLSASDSPLLVLLDKKAVTDFIDNPKDYGKPWYGQLMAGPQMLAYLIQIDYFLRKYHVELKL